MPRKKKLNWYCRHCSKHQNVKAPANERPACGGCGRNMETDDFIRDAPEPLAAPLATRAAESSARPQFDPGFVARVLDHERRIQSLESRSKSPATVIDDLEIAILQMNRDHLENLDAMLDRSLQRLANARSKVRDVLDGKRPTERSDN